MALPRPAELKASNENLKEEVARRSLSEERLLLTQKELEKKIGELTQAREDLVVEAEERRGLEKLLEQQNVVLRRSNDELELFASVTAHNLREPLRKVQSFSQLLSSGRYGAFNE